MSPKATDEGCSSGVRRWCSLEHPSSVSALRDRQGDLRQWRRLHRRRLRHRRAGEQIRHAAPALLGRACADGCHRARHPRADALALRPGADRRARRRDGGPANGIDTLKVKVAAFAGSAFIAGVAGSLYTYYIFHVGPDSVFDLDWMPLPLMMTVVGGTGTLLGPILGALVMYAVFDLARIVVPDYHPVISGLTIILAMLFLPKGLMRLGVMQRLRSA
ncbi:branched-chain amino acid ABC transporter permease [Mesorhizobium sp.]|uniref:branched-chain amino acid ABC transporter permease n=1 Tax=Mesorhizobium sp. TaxID=1871066 RepID=UPI0025F25D8A|nr:branched-chain amino acid ABC transporter permease [Mesorhizobium sp.]